MWSLRSVKSGIWFPLVVGRDYVVGRKNAQILICDDQSISRQHAVFNVHHTVENVEDLSKKSVLKLKDSSSKYGTFRNNVRLEKNEEVVLEPDDIIQFGQFDSSFKVGYESVIITTSCLETSRISNLVDVVCKLGGHIIPEWRPCCTHLVMSSVKVTIKALCCLMSLKHIVAPIFFYDLLTSFTDMTPIPIAGHYLPPVGEQHLDKVKADFRLSKRRSTLFQNKTFIFLEDEQMKKLHLPLTLGGANVTLVKQDSSFNESIFFGEGFCVVQPLLGVPPEPPFIQYVNKVARMLLRRKKRMIPESDFGLAAAYICTKRFCNPDRHGISIVKNHAIPPQTYTEEEVYVPDTEQRERSRKRVRLGSISFMGETPPEAASSNASIDQTVEESQDIPAVRKRPFQEEEETTSTSRKKIKSEATLDSGDFSESEWDLPTQPNEVPESMSKEEVVEETIEDDDDDDVQIIETESLTPETNDENPAPAAASPSRMKRSYSDLTFTANNSSNLPNGFRSKPTVNNDVSDDNEDELPRNLIKITIVDLVKQRVPLAPVSNPDCNGAVKNFKRFKKVIHAGAQSVPQIIGGSDLVVQSAVLSRAVDEWQQENAVEPQSESIEETGEFDWDSPKRKKRRRSRR